jgi:hypothetical protein
VFGQPNETDTAAAHEISNPATRQWRTTSIRVSAAATPLLGEYDPKSGLFEMAIRRQSFG